MKWTFLTLFCLYVGVHQQQLPQVLPLYLPYYYYHQPQMSRYSNHQGPYVIHLKNGFIQSSDYDFPTELDSSINHPTMDEYNDYESSELLQWAQQAQPRVPAASLVTNKSSWHPIKKNKVSTPAIVGTLQEGSSVRLFNYLYGANWLSLLRTTTSTTTVLTTVTSTMTTFTMKSCATSTQFIAPIKGCRRRRNNLIADDETLPDRVNLSPTQVQLILATSVPPLSILQMQQNDLSYPLIKTEIESSHWTEVEKPFINQHQREKRFNRMITITSSTTLTFTSYSMSTTTLTTSVTLGAEAAVSCLPSGITIC